MRLFRDLPIKWKLTLVIVLTSTATLLVAITAIGTYSLNRFHERTMQQQASVADILAATSDDALATNDKKSARDTLTMLKTNPEVLAACIYTPDGQIFAEYRRKGNTMPLPKPVLTDDSVFGDNNLLTCRIITHGDKVLGSVAMQTDLSEQYRRMKAAALIVAVVVLASALLALVLSARLQRVVSKPIVSLARVAQEVRDKKDYSLRASKTSNDEIGMLIDTFNEMLVHIQDRDVALRTANAELQHRSSARREAERALRAANEELQAEIRERHAAEESLRKLSARLLRLQDDERRRIARELHDSTAQSLFALSMHLGHVNARTEGADEDTHKVITESLALAEQCSREIRTIAYLLHPPLLDEDGLASALSWYADGFSTRSGIKVEMDITPELNRLPPDIEVTLFRVVQESLANIHRHSGSPTAKIQIALDQSEVALEVSDGGRGLPAEMFEQVAGGFEKLGVGIAGMRERIRQLGGTLEFILGNPGTVVRATLPIANNVQPPNPDVSHAA